MFGFYRVAAAVPLLRVGDVAFNVEQIAGLYTDCVENGTAAVVFPELALTSYSCGDLFFQNYLHQQVKTGMKKLIEISGSTVMIVGLPWRVDSALFNAAAVIQGGKLRGIVLKSVLPNYREFYEKRQFCSGRNISYSTIEFDGEKVPCGTNLIFESGADFTFGVEICEDLWSVIPPSSYQALAGAKVLFNLSASDEVVGKAEYRRNLVMQQSGRCLAAYVLSGAGVGESSAEMVFGGHALIGVNGKLAVENERFGREGELIFADVDVESLRSARMCESSFNDTANAMGMTAVKIDEVFGVDEIKYVNIPKEPFVPPQEADRQEICREIFQIQSAGLAKRIEHTHSKTVILGLSGGLDSTLALLVAVESCKLLNRPLSDIVAVSMPGFGTTGRTRGNSRILCNELGIELREIDISAACRQHFADIGHSEDKLDVTYENTQARERTQILMDLANKYSGIVIGTGDLSEIALGWSTFNGDHMAMYSVNCSIPKTLIRYIIGSCVGERSGAKLCAVLQDIIATPVSPELLPADKNGCIQQKTEEIIGSYALHDFFLYHFFKSGAEPEKLLFLARYAFGCEFSTDEIRKRLNIFLNRFWSSQFKRNSSPDGPKVGSVALSPRGDWRMPSDAVAFKL